MVQAWNLLMAFRNQNLIFQTQCKWTYIFYFSWERYRHWSYGKISCEFYIFLCSIKRIYIGNQRKQDKNEQVPPTQTYCRYSKRKEFVCQKVWCGEAWGNLSQLYLNSLKCVFTNLANDIKMIQIQNWNAKMSFTQFLPREERCLREENM